MSEHERVMLDMSATLLHHGHIQLIEKAAAYGSIVIGLTTDDEILEHKKYRPELTYRQRETILKALRSVSDVVPTPWLITEEILDKYQIDLLVHGDDNKNEISPSRLLVLPRTKNISSTLLREKALISLQMIADATDDLS